MIIVYHDHHKITEVITADGKRIQFEDKKTIAFGLQILAQQFPDKKIVWCHSHYKASLNIEVFHTVFHHNKMMLSFDPCETNYLGRQLGYVEESPFINVNKKVSYPTWQMSSLVGAVHASVLNLLKDEISSNTDFDYYLNSVAKVCMPLGLLCYSEPQLLKNGKTIMAPQATLKTLFRFVKQHYKFVWVVLLFFNILIYEKKFPFFSFLFSCFYQKRKGSIDLDKILVQSNLQVAAQDSIDVIIPTIGRKEYLYAVLCDLRNQTHLPKNVIIVEQNPLVNSISELDYITNEEWPFVIKHTFTHQAGACNARNLALNQVESEWVFLADDDIRIDENFIDDALYKIHYFGVVASTFSCLLEGHKNNYNLMAQTTIFGSGCSIVKGKVLKVLKFNMSLEFGYGEDTDFGLQLRNTGTDIIYFSEPSILHLKAPIGGFRIKPVLLWSAVKVQPKPSPSVMIVKQTFDTKEQILGYKLVLFLKLFKNKGWRNPLQFISLFKKQWTASRYWANQLEKK